ncbi:MAG: cell division protein FtsA [Candidatus Absconditabacteria bacterium]
MDSIRVMLDLGNGYINGVVVANDEGKKVILAKEMIKTKGMRKGKILDIDDFIYSINLVLDSFVKKLGGEFMEEVTIGISSPEMKIKRVSEQKRVLNTKIMKDDMEHIFDLLEESTEPNYETIKIMQVQWIIDDHLKLKDPIGMEGRKLELIADIFMIPKNLYNSLKEVFEKMELGDPDIIPNILGAAEVTLDIDSRDLGTVLVDIGNNHTSYVVYEEGYPILYGVLPIGGEDVTKDISIGLQIDISEAEKLKREKGIILMGDEKIEADESIDIKFLSDIIAARYEEIFERINDDLRDLGKDGKLPGGIILIGGGAKMENLDLLAKEVFKLASFYGKDKVFSIGDLSNNLQFINILGDYYWSNKYFDNTKSSFNLGVDFGFIKKIVKYVKDLF